MRDERHGPAGYIACVRFDDTPERTPFRYSLIKTSQFMYKEYLGGRGFVSKVMHTLASSGHIPESVSDPNNVVCIASGPLSGTSWPSTGRTTVAALRNPTNDGYADGNLGGTFGSDLRMAGLDMIVVIGKSPRPVLVLVTRLNGKPKLRTLSMKNEWEYGNSLLSCLFPDGREWSFLSIGPAGTHKAFCATLSCNGRTAGGGGAGCVMGWKNVKAIAVPKRLGCDVIKPSDEVEFDSLVSKAIDQIESHPVFPTFSKYGTLGITDVHASIDYMPHANFSVTNDSRWKSVSGDAMLDAIKHIHSYSVGAVGETYDEKEKRAVENEDLGCKNCPIVCGNLSKIEYENVFNLGTKLGIYDPYWIITYSSILNDSGLDVIQSTAIISALMEMWDDGVSSYEIRWGDKIAAASFLHELTNGICDKTIAGYFTRRGFFGGIREAIDDGAITVTVDPDQYYVSVKGNAMSGVVPANEKVGVCLAMATASRGADHLRSMPTLATYASWYFRSGSITNKIRKLIKAPLKSLMMMVGERKIVLSSGLYETFSKLFGIPADVAEEWKEIGFLHSPNAVSGWGKMLKFCQETYAVSDAVGTCRFSSTWRFGIGPESIASALNALFGRERYSWRTVLECGERIYALERDLWRLLSGRPFIDDSIPNRFDVDNSYFEKVLADYYNECGYDEVSGYPQKDWMVAMGAVGGTSPFESVVDELKSL